MLVVKLEPSTPSPVFHDKLCVVCFKLAHCKNYGAITCDACKMFFRRVVLLNITYYCDKNETCFQYFTIGSLLPKCKACRFKRCMQCGMSSTKIFRINTQKYDFVAALIRGLLHQNFKREEMLKTKFTFSDPSLREVIDNNGVIAVNYNLTRTEEDWRFFDICTVVEFFLDMRFMKEIDNSNDKFVLIQNFTAKTVLFLSAYRAMHLKNDKIVTPSGKETVPDVLQELCNLSNHFLCQIRSSLVGRLIELKITDEEFLLVTVILFCNPALDSLSADSKLIITKHQNEYRDALLQYCFLTCQKSAPVRFTDLLSLCHVINKNFKDVQNLTMIVKWNMPIKTKCRQIFDDIME